jgi:hypothetical protein
MQTPTISQSEYDERKSFLDDLKLLTKDEYGEMYRILKKNNVSLSENSNGVFFDMLTLSDTTFNDIKIFMELCKSQRKDESARVKTMDNLRVETKNN